MDVFVSRPTWVAKEFEEGLNTFLTLLSNLGLTPRTLGPNDYPIKAPLDEVIEIMGECSGAIVLGYPQIEVASGTLKGEKINSPLYLSTEWNHLEAGLAYAKSMPLLCIHHLSVTRGIFERGVMNAFIYCIDLTKTNWPMDAAVNGAILKWKMNCLNGIPNMVPKYIGKANPNNPTCPNCSTVSHLVYMRPIPAPFSELAGGEWECSKCKYVK